jgi:squalene-associated FAD-dependent desaturase
MRGLRALAHTTTFDLNQSFEEWLIAHGQPPELREKFWHVVLVSALSETLDRIDVGHARKVFVDTFLANRAGWRVQVPRVPPDELYGLRVEDWLRARGVEVRTSAAVRELQFTDGAATGLVLRDGSQIGLDDVILAVPHYRVVSLLEQAPHVRSELSGIEHIETAPISSVHLWFDRSITDLPHAVLVGRLSQWLFNRSAIFGQRDDEQGHYYQVVISASRGVKARSQEETIQSVVAELARILPATSEARLLRARVVTEPRAVFAPTPGVDRLRPTQCTSMPNLFLAGDWTQTGWPSTMEGAVRSGYRAAECALSRHGTNANLVQPDLPVARLSRWLLRLR